MAEAHSKYGGSVITRVMACPGSVALAETVPQAPSSKYADEGTAAHELAQLALEKDQHPADWLGEAMSNEVIVSQDMVDAVVVYLNAVTHEMALTKGAELYVEKGFVLDVAHAEKGEVFGRNDALVYHPTTGRLRVFDYKHGVGVSVSAEENAQLKFYAAGAVFSNPWKVKEVILTIVQPRDRNEDAEPVRDFVFDVADLFEFMGDVGAAIARAKQPLIDNYFQTGAHCKFCPAAVACPARQKDALDATGLAFADITEITADQLPEPSTLTPERLAQVVSGIEVLSRWQAQVQEYLESQMLHAGLKVPGWKVVDKIGRAKWISDEKSVAGDLAMLFDLDEDLVRPRKLATIGDVEKLMKAAGAGKDEIESFKLRHTLKESSGQTIAPESDRRPAVDANQRAFGDVAS